MEPFIGLIASMGGFTLTHFLLSASTIRVALAGKLGEKGFSRFYSVVSTVFFGWAIYAYVAAPYAEVWNLAPLGQILAITLMPLAAILAVCGYFSPNPLSIIGHKHMSRPARGILHITRHPVMWAMGLWSLTHLTANGDVASVIFFGLFAVVALGGAKHLEIRKRARYGEVYERLVEGTSFVPFAALLTAPGRVSIGQIVGEIGWRRLAGGLVLYLVFLFGHEWIVGNSPFPV